MTYIKVDLLAKSNPSKVITGRFGGLISVGVNNPIEKERAAERLGTMLFQKMHDIALDGRQFLIRTYRKFADSETTSEMFTNDTIRYKSILWVVLERYEDAKIGEHVLLPEDYKSIGEHYKPKSNKEDRFVQITNIRDLWFKNEFVFDAERFAFRRIEPPNPNDLILKEYPFR